MILALSTSAACPAVAGFVCNVSEGCCVPHPRQTMTTAQKHAGRNEARLDSPLQHVGLSVAFRIVMPHSESHICSGALEKREFDAFLSPSTFRAKCHRKNLHF